MTVKISVNDDENSQVHLVADDALREGQSTGRRGTTSQDLPVATGSDKPRLLRPKAGPISNDAKEPYNLV